MTDSLGSLGRLGLYQAYNKTENGSSSLGENNNGFQKALLSTFAQAAQELRQHESYSYAQAVGEKGDLTHTVMDVAELEVKTQTIVALRDKLVGLIQELEKMQI